MATDVNMNGRLRIHAGWTAIALALWATACGDAPGEADARPSEGVSVFAIPAGSGFEGAVVVSLQADRPSRIVYTRDGTLPSASNSPEYTGPLRLTDSTLLTFMAVGEDGTRSSIVEEWYARGDDDRTPIEMPAKSIRIAPDRVVFTPEPGVDESTRRVRVESIGSEPVTVFALTYGPAGTASNSYDPDAFRIVPSTTDPVIQPGEAVELAITYFTTRTSRTMVVNVETDAENVSRGTASLFLFGRMFD